MLIQFGRHIQEHCGTMQRIHEFMMRDLISGRKQADIKHKPNALHASTILLKPMQSGTMFTYSTPDELLLQHVNPVLPPSRLVTPQFTKHLYFQVQSAVPPLDLLLDSSAPTELHLLRHRHATLRGFEGDSQEAYS